QPRPRPVRGAATSSVPAPAPSAPMKVVAVTPPAKHVPDEAALEARHRSALAAAGQAHARPEASSAVVLKNAETITHAERSDIANAADLLARAGLGAQSAPKPEPAPVKPAKPKAVVVFTPRPIAELEAELARHVATGDPADDAAPAHVRATILIAAPDARGTEVALDAARRLMALHKMQAASD